MDNQEFYEYCKEVETEYRKALFRNTDVEQWDEKRKALYAKGVIHGLYRENNRCLRECLDQDVRIEKILCLVKRFVQDNRLSINERVKKNFGGVNNLRDALDKCCFDEEQNLIQLSESNILDWINDYNRLILEDLKNESENVKLRFLELYIEYYYYVKDNDDSQCKIKATYDSILGQESDYKRYNLIPIDSGKKLLALNPPRVYDETIDKTVFLAVLKPVVDVLIELYNNGLIGKYAFLGNNIEDGKIEREYLVEGIAQGKKFSYDIEKLPRVTNVYSEKDYCYDDQLWVKSKGDEITFEELLVEVDMDEVITTQMIHMQYITKEGVHYISHLDHQYIYYTKEEYKIRKRSMNQKGRAKKRCKTFKIDEAEIPPDYLCSVFQYNSENTSELEVPFIYFIVNAYFVNKELLEEYFEDIMRIQ